MQNESTNTSSLGYSLWATALAAVFFGAVANVLVLLVTKSLAPDFTPLNIVPVVFWSALAAIGAAIVFALVRKFAKKPRATFVKVSWIIFLLSFLMDIPLFFIDSEFTAGATTGGIFALAAMHVVVFVIVVPLLIKFTKQR